MRYIEAYRPFTGSEAKFLDRVPEGSQEIAENYWLSLDSKCLSFLIILIAITIIGCVSYFTVYNEQPGRHYRITHWLCFYIGTIIIVLLGTAGLGYWFCPPTINGSGELIWDIAIGNLVYSTIIFGLLSIFWWLFLPTNAYRIINKVKY